VPANQTRHKTSQHWRCLVMVQAFNYSNCKVLKSKTHRSKSSQWQVEEYICQDFRGFLLSDLVYAVDFQYGSGQYGAKLVLTKQLGRYSTRTAPANRIVGGRSGTYARNGACLFSIADSQLCVQIRIHSHLLYLTQFGSTAVSLIPGKESIRCLTSTTGLGRATAQYAYRRIR
jgi:hypothetical protein